MPRKECALNLLSQLIALWLLAHVPPTDAVRDASVGTDVFDEHGSVVALTDISGNILHTANYGPHGEDWGSSGENPTPFAWLGGYGVMRKGGPPFLEAAFSTLYLTRHRLYSPTLNRFLSAPGLCYDIATVATIGAFTARAFPSRNGSAATVVNGAPKVEITNPVEATPRVRHHTSVESLRRIRTSQEIWPARGNPNGW